MSKNYTVLLVLAIALLANTGCYINTSVDPSHVGAKLDGGRIIDCTGSGIQTDMGFFATLDQISTNTLTQVVEDKSVVTSDLQPIDAVVTLQYRRKGDCDSVKNLLTKWDVLAHDDKELESTIDNIVSQGIKTAVSQFTLNQLLADRTAMANTIQKDLTPTAAGFSVEIVSVGVKNVNPAQAYLDVLEQKALTTVQIEAAQKQQDLIKQNAANAQLQADQNVLVQQKQLLVEQATSAVQLEIATRQGKITEAQYDVYKQNPQAFELEYLNRLKDVLGSKAVVYFLTPGTNISLLLNELSGSGVIPLPGNVVTGTTPAK